MDKKVVILGAGPTGLGAATRLQQLGHTNWTLIDKNEYTGGLATTFTDPQGFLWDIGGHVIFSHYAYFNDLIDKGSLAYAKKHGCLEEPTLDQVWCTHKRESWIRFGTDTWIPYPFQNSFYMLEDKKVVKDCFDGLFEIYKRSSAVNKVTNADFHQLIMNLFGKGETFFCETKSKLYSINLKKI
jgi:protoporphyrinogen oxidase